MEKQEIDQLYHLLRRVSNIFEDKKLSTKTCLTPQEQINVVYGLCRHLLAGGDYSALVQYSQYYGESYLLSPTFQAIKATGWQPKRIVEFGAGLGWLARGLSAKFGMLPTLFVDKRPWPLINLVADLETQEGVDKVLNELEDGDLIVSCDLLHCLEDPQQAMADFAEWPMAMLEYCPSSEELKGSYSTQIRRYGACPLTFYPELKDIFPNRVNRTISIDPYVLILVDPAIEA